MVSETRRRLGPLLVVWSMLACGAGSAACAGLLGFERLTEDTVEAGGTEAGPTEAGADAPSEGGSSCTDLGIPERPKVVDAGDPDAPAAIHMAINVLDFGIDQSAPASGFNLDHACSPTVATSTCATSIDEETYKKYAKDRDDKGQDNAGFGLLGYLSYLGDAFKASSINERLAAGQFGVVARLANWNGTAEDDDVIVEIFPAIGVWDVSDAGDHTAGGKPMFKATDEWMRDRRFQNVVDASKIKSANAWVTGGRLVASFQSVTVPVTVPDDPKPLDVILLEAFITGTLVPDGTSWRLDQGVLGGRWRTADMLGQVRTIYIKDTAGLKNVVLCDPNLPINIYAPVKKEVCDGRDLRSASREDGKNMPCDAISVGVKLTTYAVDKAGPFADLPAIPARCEKDGSVPAGDDCAPAAP